MTIMRDPRPLCFVLMPFGSKTDPTGFVIDFDVVYRDFIAPAVDDAGLRAVRADEEQVGGIMHKPIYERLILCDYAVADLTTANANVYYELGVRHAFRPWSTVLIFAEGVRLPFDLAPIRGLPYALSPAGVTVEPERNRKALAERLRAAQQKTTDSPIFQLLEDLPDPDISRLKTDVFRDRVEYSSSIKAKLAAARSHPVEAVRAIGDELGDLGSVESGVVVDLLLSFRAVEAWDDMVALVERMPEPLARSVLVREQYALALNRAGRGDNAEEVLVKLIDERGPSSETYGILGRVYKDRWERARAQRNEALARGLLNKAIDAYVKGFESDWRDAYPGINAVQLMELRDPPDPRRDELLPIVTYSVKRRIQSKQPDYWDYATVLELAVINRDEDAVRAALADAVTAVRESWEPRSTLATLRRLRQARETRGERADWMTDVERTLETTAGDASPTEA
ncbi:MAG: TRAFs-binding domain-containing protein [Pseudonocardiaceae bacterium]